MPRYNRMEEIKMARERLVSQEVLLSQGGFFREILLNDIKKLYSDVVIDMVSDLYGIKKGFVWIADKVTEALNNLDKFIEIPFAEEGESVSKSEMEQNEAFAGWYLKNLVQTCMKEYGKSHFWSGWEIGTNTTNALSSLSLLDEKILYYYLGADGKKKRAAADIASLPEFECDVCYIDKVLDKLENSLVACMDEIEGCIRKE